jgi:uncharacterized DUF497 family protein
LADAITALEDEHALTIRDPYSEDEERWITLGLDAQGQLVVVVLYMAGRGHANYLRAKSHPKGTSTIL